jgi:hypothetical protein
MSGRAFVARNVRPRNGCGGMEAAIRKEMSRYARSDWGGSGFQVGSVADGSRFRAGAGREFLREAAADGDGLGQAGHREGQADGGRGVCSERLGQTAEQNAVKNKEQAKQDAQAALEQTRASIASARELLAGKDAQALKRGKETREVLKQIESELNAVDSSLVNVTALQQQEKYKQALSMAQSANQSAQTKMQELQQAIENRKQIQGMKK